LFTAVFEVLQPAKAQRRDRWRRACQARGRARRDGRHRRARSGGE